MKVVLLLFYVHILFFSFFSCVSTVDETNLGKEGGRCLRGNTCEYDTLICIEGKCRLDMCQNVTCLNTWEKCDYKDGFCHPKNKFCSSDSDCNLKNNEYCSDNHLCRVSNCTGKSCAELSIECGITNDGCGNLDCGRCKSGKFCNLGICEISSCTPKTCEGLSIKCGIIDDGCENTIDCGICETGKACIDGACKIESGICENGSERLGTTICGLNTEGFYKQDCINGVWVDNDDCTGTDICFNGSKRIGSTACGLNGEGFYKQNCIDGQWTNGSDCTGTDECINGEVFEEFCGSGDIQGHMMILCDMGHWMELEGCICDEGYEWNEAMDRCYEKCDTPDYDCTIDEYSCVESSDILFGSFCFSVSEIGEHCGNTSEAASYYCVPEAECLSYNEENSYTCYEKCENANSSCYIDGYECKNTGSDEYGWLCLP